MPNPTACALNPASCTASRMRCMVELSMPSPVRKHARQHARADGARGCPRTRRTLDDAAPARHFEALGVHVAAKHLLRRAQAHHHRLHGVSGVWPQHHEAALGQLLRRHGRQDGGQRVLIVVAVQVRRVSAAMRATRGACAGTPVHDARKGARTKVLNHMHQRGALRVPRGHDAATARARQASATGAWHGPSRNRLSLLQPAHLCSLAGMLCATGLPPFSTNCA